MAEGGDEIAESPDPQPSPTNSFVVRKDGSADLNYPVGTFLSVSGGPCVPIILISSISDQLLVSVPLEAWHRLKANRRLPGDALSKAVSVEVPAVRDLDREVIEFEQKIKVWVGYLKKSLESCLNFEPDYAVALACQFMTEDGEEGFVPFAESLVTLADEKFSFLSAMSGAEGDGEKPSDPSSKAKKASDPALDRIARLEEGMVAIQTSLQELLSQRNTVAAAPPVMTPKPKRESQKARRRWFGSSRPSGCSVGSDFWDRQKAAGGVQQVGCSSQAKVDRHARSAERSPRTSQYTWRKRRRSCPRNRRGSTGSRSRSRLSDSHCEVDFYRPEFEFEKERPKHRRPFRRFVGSRGGVIIQQFYQFESAPLLFVESLEAVVEGGPGGDLQSDRRSNVGRFWCSRKCSRRTSSFRYLQRMGGTPFENSKSESFCSCSLGCDRSTRCVEERPCIGSKSQAGTLFVPARPGFSGSWTMDSGSGREFGRSTPFLLLFKAHSSRSPRTSAHSSMANSLGRKFHVQGQRAGRVRREKVQARQEISSCPTCSSGSRGVSEEGQWQERKPEVKSKGFARGAISDSIMKDPQLGHAQPSNKLHEENPQKANKNVNEHSKTSKSSKPLPAEFKVTSWWNSCFRLVLQVGGSLASFARSFFRKPVMPFEEKATAVMWPMPLPYPAVMKRSAVDPICSNDVSFQCGVNLAVLMLNWLHLKRPSTCPAEITLYAPLSRLQWRVVRQVELTMNAWRDAEPVTAFNMGRAAAKVENIERALERLCTFESGLFELFDEALPDSSSSLSRSASRKFFAPGLQADGGGDIVGQSSSCGGSVAKPIIADRLDFRGVPKFDPKPFLDKQGRFIFDDPLSAALKPEDAVEDPPQVKLFGDACELWKLFQKLDATGRLGAIPDTKVLPGFQAGLFAVGKDESKDRLIFDSRPFNTLESPPNRWIKSMAAASSLVEVHLEPGEVCVVSGTDLREFYYSFEVGNSRLIRNSLLFLTTAKEIWDWNCCTEEIRQHPGKIWLGLRTLAMGDTCAVELAQTAHVGILRQMGLIRENNLLTMSMSVPRVPSFIGIVIDDLIAFEKIARAALSTSEMTKSEETVRSAVGRFADLGLIPHDGKTFYNDLHAEFWGATFDGDSGYVRAGLKRMIPILFATVGILKLGLCSISLLQVLVGCWTSAFLFRRRMLSIFNVVYEVFQRASKQSDVIRLSEALKEELMLCVSLCPLAATFLRTRTSSQVYASDASSVGWAVISADIPNWLASEVHRHALRKRVWTKLLSPSKSLLKERGVLEPSEELPAGEAFATHPLWSLIAGGFQFQTLKSRRTKAGRRINIDEMIGMLEAEKSAVETGFPVRYFSLADSQVSLGALLKGRSSSIGLNALLQESLAVHLSTSVVPSFGFLPSKENPADDPTRGVPLRSPVHELPEWMKKQSSFSPHEAVAELDKWLDARNSSPWHLSGLPDLSELDGDFVESQMWKRSCR